MKKEQGKSEKGAKGNKLKGAGSKGGNCKRSREHGPPLTEAHKFSPMVYQIMTLNQSIQVLLNCLFWI